VLQALPGSLRAPWVAGDRICVRGRGHRRDPAEFLPGDDELEASASELANGPEEDAVATYGDAELIETERRG
jgi:hypothetical protein